MTKCVLIAQLEIPHNLFGPSAQIGQLFGIFLKETLSHGHCPWPMTSNDEETVEMFLYK